MRVALITIATLFGALTNSSDAQTRAQEDSANPLRRCAIEREPKEPADSYAVRCAERFVAEQGYTDSSSTRDTSRIVPEGIEWSASKVECFRDAAEA
jgi:hypothetical protein